MNNTFRKSYANINALLDEIFPPVSDMNKARTTSDQFVDGTHFHPTHAEHDGD